jgi:beta-galactosidase
MYWDEWHVKDLTDHLLRDRNHPSIFSWSIGNEILEQWDTTGIQIARDLTSIVKQYAPNMPVTSGCNDPEPHNNIIKSGALDLIGYNYKHEAFEQFHQKFPGQKFIATETTSSLNSRGVYNMPADSVRIWPKQWDIPFHEGNPDNSCSSYDNCRAPWGSTHEDTWKIIKRNDYLAGMYIWTGFDYLGEPTPYLWPSRSSYFGIIDLAGFPKDIYYMYQSEWTDKQVLHLFPHWNWNEGQTVDVWAYTNFTEVELFLNDKSLGKKSKLGEELHLQWQVPYVPGILKAIGKNEKGDTKQVEINTAGTPAKIKLEADRTTINADGVDLSFVTVTILDKDNNIVPYANNLVHFELNNMATITAVDNGLQTSMESFKANFRKANNGKCLVILQSGELTGVAKLTAKSEGLQDANLEIKIN